MTVQDPTKDAGAFLSVFAALLLENVLHFEETASRVTDLVMGSGRPPRELIVALQSFDRLKQEFEALGDALTRYAESANTLSQDSEHHIRLAHEIIAEITVADLKDRLMRRLRHGVHKPAIATMSSELAKEVNVDVEF